MTSTAQNQSQQSAIKAYQTTSACVNTLECVTKMIKLSRLTILFIMELIHSKRTLERLTHKMLEKTTPTSHDTQNDEIIEINQVSALQQQ